jgi:hypothetical protein
MTALLFALVDAVYMQHRNSARQQRARARDDDMAYLMSMFTWNVRSANASRGWWRSLWPLGGGV